MESAFGLIRRRLLPLFKDEMKELVKSEGICKISGITGTGYIYKDSEKVESHQSPEVRVFHTPSLKNIGFFKGTFEQPTKGMRFIDYNPAILLIPLNDDKIELWCSGKYAAKVSPSTPFKIKELGGSAALMELLEDNRSLLCMRLSPRRELWFKNLQVGDEDNLLLCTEAGVVVTPRKGWHEFKALLIELKKSDKTELISILRMINDGRLSPHIARVQDYFSKHAVLFNKIKLLLPTEPNARKVWLDAAGAV